MIVEFSGKYGRRERGLATKWQSSKELAEKAEFKYRWNSDTLKWEKIKSNVLKTRDFTGGC